MNFMVLEHIALVCKSENEIEDFYRDILGFEIARCFELNKKLSSEIFNVDKDVKVYLLKKDDIFIEAFINPAQDKINHDFRHICISLEDREEIINRLLEKKYNVLRIKRDKSDLVFMKDKSGNIFEVKQAIRSN